MGAGYIDVEPTYSLMASVTSSDHRGTVFCRGAPGERGIAHNAAEIMAPVTHSITASMLPSGGDPPVTAEV